MIAIQTRQKCEFSESLRHQLDEFDEQDRRDAEISDLATDLMQREEFSPFSLQNMHEAMSEIDTDTARKVCKLLQLFECDRAGKLIRNYMYNYWYEVAAKAAEKQVDGF